MPTISAPNMLASAVYWSTRGVPVFPLWWPNPDGSCACGDAECRNPGKHPLTAFEGTWYTHRGLHDATTDGATIAKWWRGAPLANIGIRTGIVYDVIDIDGAVGEASYKKLVAEHGVPFHVCETVTGRVSGGRHLYIPTGPDGGVKALTGGRTSPHGIDVKGNGGYVIAPDSLHASGRRYSWKRHLSESRDVGTVPWDRFYQLLKDAAPKSEAVPLPLDRPRAAVVLNGSTSAYGAKVLENACALVRAQTEGSRWQTVATEALVTVARAIDGQCLDKHQALGELTAAARAIGLAEAEVRRLPGLLDDILTKGISKPIAPAPDVFAGVPVVPLPVMPTPMVQPVNGVNGHSDQGFSRIWENVGQSGEFAGELNDEGEQADEAATPSLDDFYIAEELRKLRAREEAKRLLRAEQNQRADGPPRFIGLGDFLAVPDEPVTYRIDQLWPSGGRVILAAQMKAGKSTMIGNLIRSLVDGERFLDTYEVTRPRGRVVLIDDELDERMLRRWLRDQAIVNVDQVVVVPLRGRVAEFDLLNRDTRAWWAQQLASVDAEIVIFDCLRPVLDAIGLDEDKEAGRFLVAFDSLLSDAKVGEGMIVHHMGHNGERSRGSTRLRDWPDVEWRLLRQGDSDDMSGPRFFTAYGRDVDVAEQQLAYESLTRRLSISGAGSRKQAKARTVVPGVLELLERNENGLSGHQIELALTAAGERRQAVREALSTAIADGLVITVRGPRNATIHQLNPSSSPVRRSSPPVRRRTESEFASSPLGGELTGAGEVELAEPSMTANSTGGAP